MRAGALKIARNVHTLSARDERWSRYKEIRRAYSGMNVSREQLYKNSRVFAVARIVQPTFSFFFERGRSSENTGEPVLPGSTPG